VPEASSAASPGALPEPTLVLAAHGTQSGPGAVTLIALLRAVRRLRPPLASRLCFVDVLLPSVSESLAALTGPVVIVPVLLSVGAHVRVDIPRAVGRRKQVLVARHLGPDRLLSTALADQLAAARGSAPPRPVALVAAGSTDADAGGELEAAAADLAQLTGLDVRPLTMASPLPSLAGLHVAPYLLAEGVFFDAVRAAATEAGATVVGAPLGTHPAVAELILRRYDEAIAAGSAPGGAAAASSAKPRRFWWSGMLGR
jgi:sirohydrochlorin ferrochelatase